MHHRIRSADKKALAAALAEGKVRVVGGKAPSVRVGVWEEEWEGGRGRGKGVCVCVCERESVCV